MNNLNGYVVGTNADGSAGKLMVNNASMKGVEINTAFAAERRTKPPALMMWCKAAT